MSTGFQPTLDFEAADHAAEDGAALVIDIDGYEGPLHVLLALARVRRGPKVGLLTDAFALPAFPMAVLAGFPPIPDNAVYRGPSLFIAGGRSDYLLPEHESAIREPA